MALSVVYQLPSGVTAGYHRIKYVQLYYPDNLVDVQLVSYLDQAARVAGQDPVGLIETRFTFAELGLAAGAEPTRIDLYTAVTARAATAGEGDPLHRLKDAVAV